MAVFIAVMNEWLGRKDSNPRMAESKSAALTSLATPQLESIYKIVERVPFQSLRNESPHPPR